MCRWFPAIILLLAIAAVLPAALASPAPTYAQQPPYDISVEVESSTTNGSWRFTARNLGVEDAFGVTVRVELPEQVPAEGISVPNTEYDPDTGVWTWRVGRLEGGTSKITGLATKLAPDIMVPSNYTRLAAPARAVISSHRMEPPHLLHNNSAEAWAALTRQRSIDRADTEADLQLHLDNPLPSDGDIINLAVRVGKIEPGFGDATAYGLRTRIQLPPGLGVPTETFVVIPPGDDTFTAVPPDQARTWEWYLETLQADAITMNLSVRVTDQKKVEGECITAELTVERPGDDPSNNTARACFDLPLILFQEGEVGLLTVYPCVGVTTYPCTGTDTVDTVEVVATDEIGAFERVLEPGKVIIQVEDPSGRVIGDDNSVSWQTRASNNEADRGAGRGVGFFLTRVLLDDDISDWDKLTYRVGVRVLGGAAQPSDMSLLSAGNGRVIFHPVDSPERSIDLTQNRRERAPVNLFADFTKLGTYALDFSVEATHATESGDCDTNGDNINDAFCDTGTYIFHVGPIAELGVRDGGASPLGLEPGQTAFTVVAFNNGPDDALGAKVEVTLPQGATLAQAIPSTGTYNHNDEDNTGVWDFAGLRFKGYYQATGSRLEGEDLTLILNCPAGGCGGAKATARIYNDNDNHPYRVVIGGGPHDGTVYDYNDGNNEATLTARPGTGEVGPAVEAQPFVAVTWQRVDDVYGFPVSHYQVWRSGCGKGDEPAKVADVVTDTPWVDPAWQEDDVAPTSWVDLNVMAGDTYCYQVRGVNDRGTAGPFSLAVEKTARAPVTPTAGMPEAPALTAQPNEPYGRDSILLTWNKPVESGSFIISYTIEVADSRNGPWAEPAPTLGPDDISWLHAGLDPGTRKYYRIKATNEQGDSPWSNLAAATTHARYTPSWPTNLRAEPQGGNAIVLTWDAPEDTGDPSNPDIDIVRYEVQYSADRANWSAETARWSSAGRTADGETRTFTHNIGVPGTTNHYRVAAHNGRALSAWSEPASATTPTGVPGVPRLTAEAKSYSTINLTWTVPASNDGPITRYEIQWSDDGAPGNWTMLEAVVETTGEGVVRNSHADSGLEPVTTRYYRIRAVNGMGAGSWSRATSATTPTTPGADSPSAPLNLRLESGDAQIEVLWDPPADNGGADIKEYVVQLLDSGEWKEVDRGAFTGLLLTEEPDGRPLTNGRRYYVRVRADNADGGMGDWAQGSAVPNTPPRAPSEPPNVVPTGGDGEITVTWREPYDVGHPALSGYRIQYREDLEGRKDRKECVNDWLPASPFRVGSNARSYTITTNLENGTTYQVQVWAVNSEGDSPKAGCDGKLTATPEAAEEPDPPPDDPKKGEPEPERRPSEPRNLALTPGDGEIQVSWDAPTDLGNPEITGYTLEYRADGGSSWLSRKVTTTSATITGLDNGKPYDVQVLASNASGDATAGPQRATPEEPPDSGTAPQKLKLVEQRTFEDVDGSTVKEFVVDWELPDSSKFPDVTGYLVEFRRGESGDWLDRRCTVSDDPEPIEETCSDHRGGRTSVAGIMGVSSGTYQVRVAAVNREGTGAWARVTVQIQ